MLALAGARVVVIGPAGRGEPHVGESLAPAARPALARLGVLDLVAAAHPLSYGNASAWGGAEVVETSALRSPYGPGWQVDRAAFDATLAEAADAAGAHRRRSAVRSLRRIPGGWDLDGARAANVVDATGRAARVARWCGARRRRLDRLVAVGAFLPARAEGEHVSFVESVPGGWWYAAPTSGGRYAVLAMTDADLVRGSVGSPEEWWDALRATPALAARLAAAGVVGPPAALRTVSAATAVTTPAAGAGWAAVGDAAMATDPLAARGLLTALGTAVATAEALVAARHGDGDALGAYSDHVRRAFDEYRRAWAATYARERRWDTVFWARRTSPTAP
jgi:flavin-dependent dehydrogenase